METLLIVLVCVAVGSACGIVLVLLSAIALGARRERNERAHRLGQLLVIHHPEWK
jgi:hypothetical protein